MAKPQSRQIGVEQFKVPAKHRKPDPKAVKALASSMEKIGLQIPITARENDAGDLVLVSGANRLAAAKVLGWDRIEAVVKDWTREQARMWEISENLHRTDLTTQERADQVAEWIELSEEKESAKPTHSGSVSEGGRGKEGGIRKAARELGISQGSAERAEKIASIQPKARAVADKAGLNSVRAREEIARAGKDEAAQVTRAKALAKVKKDNEADPSEKQLFSLKANFDRVPPKVQKRFIKWLHLEGHIE